MHVTHFEVLLQLITALYVRVFLNIHKADLRRL